MKRFFALIIAIVCLFSLCGSASAYEGETLEVPQIRIVTENGNGTSLQKEDGYQSAHITITDTDGSVLEDDALIKVRGNSTALSWVEKKSFTIKYSKKRNVLQMGNAKKWALLANLFDPTLIRNYIGLDTAASLGLEYTSQQRISELWLDGEYRGCYILTEPIGDGADRVNIDIDNGEFIVEYEATRKEPDVTYIHPEGFRFAVKEHDPVTDDERDRISGIMADIISTVKSGSMEEISQKIDIPSFVKYYLLNEYLKTVDFGFSSVFFYYRNDVLYAGPAWDYDLSMGNANPDYSASSQKAYVYDGLFANEKNLFAVLCGYDWFNYEVKKAYEEYGAVFSNIGADGGLIDTLSAEYRNVFDRNYREAGWNVSRYWVNVQKKPLSTYDENLSYLKSWCVQRDLWLTYWFSSQKYYIRGDSDSDGEVTVMDATNIQKILAYLITDYDEMTVVRSKTSDDNLSVLDATLIQKYLAHISNPNRINEAVKYSPSDTNS